MKDLLNRTIEGESLDALEASELMGQMMDEEMSAVQLAGFLVALRAKGENANEVSGFATTMRSRARQVEIDVPLADTCGTGGDNRGTFNISTAAALILAACGQPVAKHGNRAASGRCGSADVLEALGVEVSLPPEGVVECVKKADIGFLFAPAFHPAMKFAAVPRRELGVRTVFNLLGPLTNPARPSYQLLGVSSASLLDLMAEALMKLGVKRALVVHSLDGMDEISVAGDTEVREVADGSQKGYRVCPDDFGLPPCDPLSIRGGDVEANADMLMGVLNGENGGPRSAAVLNAAAALYISERVQSFEEGARRAEKALDSGEALRRLETLKTVSQSVRNQP